MSKQRSSGAVSDDASWWRDYWAGYDTWNGEMSDDESDETEAVKHLINLDSCCIAQNAWRPRACP